MSASYHYCLTSWSLPKRIIDLRHLPCPSEALLEAVEERKDATVQ